MFHQEHRRRNLSQRIFLLWINWAVGMAFLSAIVILTAIIPKDWFPPVALAMALVLAWFDRRNRRRRSPICFRLPYMVAEALAISGIFMFLLLIWMKTEGATEFTGQPVNLNVSLIAIMVTAPAMIIPCCYYMFYGHKAGYCRDCINQHGNPVDRGVSGVLFDRESRYQLKLLFAISVLLTVVGWVYYFVFYNNVNHNKSDIYFFVVFPVAVYVLSIIYMGSRYYSLWVYYVKNDEIAHAISSTGTTLRYIVIAGNKVFLSTPPSDGVVIKTDDLKLDIPTKISLDFRESMSDYDAEAFFRQATRIADFNLRFIYESSDYDMYHNVFHYVVTIPESEMSDLPYDGEWFDQGQLREMIAAGIVTTAFAAEIHRIYTVVMAWKTYDRNGRRLYPIKNYVPTFRLRDLDSWDVDFTDTVWLSVAAMNQDKPFFKIRQFWRRHVRGEGNDKPKPKK